MTAILRGIWRDEAGLILSAELVIILTIAVLGMIVGLSNLQNALIGEFADLSLAFQNLNQSYSTPSYRGCWKIWGRTSWTAGSCFIDCFDGCVGNNQAGFNNCEICSGANSVLPSNGSSTVVDPFGSSGTGVYPHNGLQPTPDSSSVNLPAPTQ